MVCPFELKIQKHRMQLISTEIRPIKPVFFDTAFSTSGERFDFVLDANQNPDNYWIRIRAVGPCEYLQIESFAVLTYTEDVKSAAFTRKPMPSFLNDYPRGVVSNSSLILINLIC